MLKLSVVVPCYNEEEVIPEASSRLLVMLEKLQAKKKISERSMIVFVDDGSKDQTWRMIENIAARDSRFAGIKLSRNIGHQRALLAGLLTSPGDVLVSIDADLQDDIDVIEKMIDDYNSGNEIVYGVRRLRNSDTYFKRKSALLFYKLINALGADTIKDHADFRLMSRKSIEALRDFQEFNVFLRGIVPLVGFNHSVVYYDRSARFAGESKYPLRKMVGLALDGITSLSSTPLRFITYLGLLVFLATVVMGIWVVFSTIGGSTLMPGWASTVLPMYLLGGLQIFCLGIIGEYLGKIYREVKRRPRFIVEKTLGFKE